MALAEGIETGLLSRWEEHMGRFILRALAVFAIGGASVGCQNAQRLGCEFKTFYLDVQRNIFGIDYPHGAPETYRQKYYGLPDPGKQPVCDDY
jgi:hypothetical protein